MSFRVDPRFGYLAGLVIGGALWLFAGLGFLIALGVSVLIVYAAVLAVAAFSDNHYGMPAPVGIILTLAVVALAVTWGVAFSNA